MDDGDGDVDAGFDPHLEAGRDPDQRVSRELQCSVRLGASSLLPMNAPRHQKRQGPPWMLKMGHWPTVPHQSRACGV